MLKKGWIPEKPGPNSLAEKLTVSARQFELFCYHLALDVQSLKGKTIISVGNGLSDSVIQMRSLGHGTRAYGIDPIYAYLGNSYREFLDNLERLNLEKAGHLTEKNWRAIRDNKRYHLPALGEAMRINEEKVDLVLIANLLGNLGRKKLIQEILSESLRVIKKDREIRVSDLAFQMLEPESKTLSLVFHNPENIRGKGVSLNEALAGDLLKIFIYLEESGAQIYTVRNTSRLPDLYPPKVYFLKKSLKQRTLPIIYQRLIIRKDQKPPRLTLHILPSDLKIANIKNPLVHIKAKNSKNPERVLFDPVLGGIDEKPFASVTVKKKDS